MFGICGWYREDLYTDHGDEGVADVSKQRSGLVKQLETGEGESADTSTNRWREHIWQITVK